jgi:hypothetical protein
MRAQHVVDWLTTSPVEQNLQGELIIVDLINGQCFDVTDVCVHGGDIHVSVKPAGDCDVKHFDEVESLGREVDDLQDTLSEIEDTLSDGTPDRLQLRKILELVQGR